MRITRRISYLFHEPIPDVRELARRMAHSAALGYDGIELSAAHPLGLRKSRPGWSSAY